MKNEEKTKKLGQVFTPERIVKIMLDEAGFDRTNVLVFKIMEPSFGKGVFLIEIIKRIIRKGRDFNYSKKQIENIIEENVYGIEVDEELFDETINSIKLLLANNNLNTDLDFKLFNEDSIKIWKQFVNKFDIVIGNPPYVRTKHLPMETRNNLKEFKFSMGLQDIYLCFVELSYKMLNANGKLVMITPNSWFLVKYAERFRNFLQTSRSLKTLILVDSKYNIFKQAVDVGIMSIYKNLKTNTSVFDLTEDNLSLKEEINLEEVKFNNAFAFRSNKKILEIMKKGFKNKVFKVSNGIVTLKDEFFIRSEPIGDDLFIKCLKGTTGKYHWLFWPYDKDHKLLSLETIRERNPQMFNLLLENKELLLDRTISDKNLWWALGRCQGIKQVSLEKYVINNLFLDQKTIKLNFLPKNTAQNSGFYIETAVDFDKIKKLVYSNTFIEYAKTFGNRKRGGFHILTAKQIEIFLNTFYELVFN